MKKEHIPCYISILSLIVSGIAVGVSFYRTEKLSMDYLGVIVGILSLLVTILIGWNIYSALSIESKMNKLIDKVEKENSDFQEHINHDIEGIRNEQTKIAESMANAIATTKIDLYATSVTLNRDYIKVLSDKENQETDEFEFHMIVNYLQLILSEIQAGFMKDAIIHSGTLVMDVRNRTPRLDTRQINMIHRLCGLISYECNNRQIADIGVAYIFSHIENRDNNNPQL